jgi:hypothetical protein
MNAKQRKTRLALAVSASMLGLGFAWPAHAVEVGTKDGWSASFDGIINAFAISAKADKLGGADSSVKETRVTSGWNPSKFNAHFKAPEYNGLTVTGNFQYATRLTGNGADGVSAGGANLQQDVRVLDVGVAGSFGSIGIGRSWSIFNSQAIIHDGGSGLGVGALCGLPGGMVGGQCGRIGTGYSWTAFASRIEYDTPDLGGFSARIGLFDPGQPGGSVSFQTNSPRVEAEATFAAKFDGGAFKVWAGILDQSLGGKAGGPSIKTKGWDGGAHVDVGGLGVTAAYTKTKGFGLGNYAGLGAGGIKLGSIFCPTATSCKAADADQWYTEVDYRMGKTTFGASTGRGKQKSDAGFGIGKIDARLNMAYIHHDLTPQLHVMGEYTTYKGDLNGTTDTKYSFFSLGMQYDF